MMNKIKCLSCNEASQAEDWPHNSTGKYRGGEGGRSCPVCGHEYWHTFWDGYTGSERWKPIPQTFFECVCGFRHANPPGWGHVPV